MCLASSFLQVLSMPYTCRYLQPFHQQMFYHFQCRLEFDCYVTHRENLFLFHSGHECIPTLHVTHICREHTSSNNTLCFASIFLCHQVGAMYRYAISPLYFYTNCILAILTEPHPAMQDVALFHVLSASIA